jgi:hypothetical protein
MMVINFIIPKEQKKTTLYFLKTLNIKIKLLDIIMVMIFDFVRINIIYTNLFELRGFLVLVF